ncbi:MAG: stage III sporulation protein AB [Oscillospiraceae bacterium]|nr:stage III sporulation protein AB [Oscillospiraceae bacterium]
MHALGVIILTICPILIGLTYSITLTKNQRQIGEIIQLINWIETEIRYKQTNLDQMLIEASSKEAFSSLEFLSSAVEFMKIFPFPQAWKKSISNWNSKMDTYDKQLLFSFADILGASDVTGQLTALEHMRVRFQSSFNKAKETCDKNGKLSKSLGVLAGLAICVLML